MNRSRLLHGIGLVALLLFFLPGGAPPAIDAGTIPPAAPRPLAEPWVVEQVDAPRDFQDLGERSLAVDSAFRPHLVYAGMQLYITWHDGTAWQFETVDNSLGAAGGFPSLALDTAGEPRIAYQANGNLKYAWRSGGSWQIVTVGSGGYFPSLALDAAGQPHIAYGTSDSGAQLRYAWYDGTTWHIQDLGSGGRPSLVLDAAGQPHLSYLDGVLRYAWYDGASWHTTTVDVAAGERSSLALDTAGRPHIAYDAGELRYAWHDGVGWRIETVSPAGEDASLILDAAGRPHIAYREGNALRYAWHDGSAWQIATVVEGETNRYISITLDPLDQVNVGWFSPSAGLLRRAWYNGAAWWIETVDRTGDVGRHSSLALDAAGWPHVSYCRYHSYVNPYPSQCDSLEYAFFAGGSWQQETVEQGADVGYDTSLAIDAAGWPHIGYRRADTLRYATYDGAAWQLTTVDEAGAAENGTSLALDAAGWPHISYQYDSGGSTVVRARYAVPLPGPGDANEGDALTALKYAWYSGANWYTEIVETSVTGGYRHSSLALDAAGRPHISYGLYSEFGTDWLKYAWYDGTDWHIQAVDSGEGVGGYTSLVLDAAGRPHISYSGGNTLRYAWHDGTTWHIQVVDNGGTYTSLALDAAGRPHISYYDWSNYRLRYAWYDGAAWHIELPDGDVDVGTSTSLALDAAGRPRISYYDAGRHDLRLALQCLPLVGVEVAGPVSLPAGESGLYTALPLPTDATPPLAYTWDNGTTGPAALYSWLLPGDYTVAVAAANLCGQAQGSLNVTVTCEPVEAVQLAGPRTLPTGQIGIYQAAVQPISPSLPMTLTWNNGATGPIASYSWTTTGTYTVAVTATNICGQARAAFTVTAFCQPVEELQVQGPQSLPLGQAGTYQAAIAPITASLPLTLTWSNGATGPTASYSWTATGTYTVAVTATNACGPVRETVSVTVFCDPVTGVEVGGPATLYVGAAGVYTAAVQPFTATAPVVLTWDNGAVGPTATYSWTTTGTYTLGVTATNACGSAQQSLAVEVIEVPVYTRVLPIIPKVYSPPPCLPVIADFSWTPLTPTIGQLVRLTAVASGTAPISFTWDLGNGLTRTGAIATHAYTVTGIYPVTLTAANACGTDIATHTLTVTCTAPGGTGFAWTPLTPTVGQVVTLTAAVTGTTPLTYTWNFGDYSWVVGPLATMTHTYAAAGTYTVTLVAANPCGQDVVTHTLVVLPLPCTPVYAVDFAWTPFTPTVGQVVTLTAVASGTAPISFTWGLGDGITKTGALITHTYAVTGTYTVTLTAANVCGTDVATHTLVVLQTYRGLVAAFGRGTRLAPAPCRTRTYTAHPISPTTKRQLA